MSEEALQRHLQAASGYVDLGLPAEALEELNAVESAHKMDLRVMARRVQVYGELKRWQGMKIVAAMLCTGLPDAAQWPVSLAYATRRCESLEAGLAVLQEAVGRFPEDPTIHFNLACYECQLGRLDAAQEHLAEAIRLGPACREMALEDPDLAPLHRELLDGERI